MGSDKEESRQGLAGQLDTLPFRGPYVCSLLFFFNREDRDMAMAWNQD